MGWGYLRKFITVVLVLVLLLIPEVTLGKSLAFSGLSSPTIAWGVRINWSENFVSLDLNDANGTPAPSDRASAVMEEALT